MFATKKVYKTGHLFLDFAFKLLKQKLFYLKPRFRWSICGTVYWPVRISIPQNSMIDPNFKLFCFDILIYQSVFQHNLGSDA